jgi:3-hydroxybutyryl-CoA dehydratase
MLSYVDLKVGQSFTALNITITQEDINLYARAARDFNPIHLDIEFAKKTPARGIIAHGMLILAYVSQIMTDAFGLDWLNEGKMNVKFKTPARPGDNLTVQGKITRLQKQGEITLVFCEVACLNQSGDIVIIGETSVSFLNAV